MPRATEMGVAKPDDSAVFMLITSAILVHTRLILAVNVVRYGIRVGTKLHNAEGRTSPWKGVSHTVGSDDGIDVLEVVSNSFCRLDGFLLFRTAHHNE